MANRKHPSRPAAQSKFKVGDQVRVRHGVQDTNYPDTPLGGWAGTITAVHEDGMYEIRWSQETLAGMHPVVKKRCEKDGLILEEYGLAEDELEPDPGGPLEMEQPSEITTKPLSPKDQDDRIRMVFGLTSNDPLPEVDEEALRVYYRHLVANLTFPFEATYQPERGRPERVKVLSLGNPDEEPELAEMCGIVCEVRLDREAATVPLGDVEVAKGRPGRQLIQDYSYWFHNLC